MTDIEYHFHYISNDLPLRFESRSKPRTAPTLRVLPTFRCRNRVSVTRRNNKKAKFATLQFNSWNLDQGGTFHLAFFPRRICSTPKMASFHIAFFPRRIQMRSFQRISNYSGISSFAFSIFFGLNFKPKKDLFSCARLQVARARAGRTSTLPMYCIR